MTLRLLLFFLGAVYAALPAAACNMDLADRGASVADYVETVRPCLYARPVGFDFDADMERDFVERINAARAEEGLPALIYRPDLLSTSRFHSLDMAHNDFFGHVGPDGRTPSDRLAAFDRRALIQYSAENVAMVEVVNGRWNLDRDAVGRLHQNLMDSPGHRANILSEEATHVAVGVARTESGVWVTQTFLNLAGIFGRDVPVRMRPGDRVNQAPVLQGWQFMGFDAQLPDGEYLALRLGVPQGLSGDILLAAEGQRPGDKLYSFYTIRLPGPAVTVGR